MDKRIKEWVQFHISSQSDELVDATLSIDENLPSFKGHFPGNPILPAVSIIDINLYLLERTSLPVSYDKIEVKRSKFTGMVKPGHTIHIRAQAKDKGQWEFVWRSQPKNEKLAQVLLVV